MQTQKAYYTGAITDESLHIKKIKRHTLIGLNKCSNNWFEQMCKCALL